MRRLGDRPRPGSGRKGRAARFRGNARRTGPLPAELYGKIPIFDPQNRPVTASAQTRSDGIYPIYAPQRHSLHSQAGPLGGSPLRADGRHRKPRRTACRTRHGSFARTRFLQGDRATARVSYQLPPRKPRRRAERLHDQGGNRDPYDDAAGRPVQSGRADRGHRLPLHIPGQGAGKGEGHHRR